jgi:protein involved in polysaccharide export with SLBB domain
VIDLGPVAQYADSGKADTAVFDGDRFTLWASTKTSADYIQVDGSVWYPGDYPWTAGMDVKAAVALAGGMNDEAYGKRLVVQRNFPDSTFQFLSDDSASSNGLKLEPKDRVIVLSTRVLRNLQSVSIEGAVKTPQLFEFRPGTNLKELIALAGGFTKQHLPGKVTVERLKTDGSKGVDVLELKITDDLSIENREDLILQPGDRVLVPYNPDYYEQELVTIAGAVQNPGVYSLAYPNEPFKEFMERVAIVAPGGYLKGGQFFRKRSSAKVLGNLALLDTAKYQINMDIENAMKSNNQKAFALLSGDSIYIPYFNPTVRLTGEVISPGNVLWRDGWDVDDYLNAGGGLTLTADEDRIVVTYADGSKSAADRVERDPDPGSEIFVSYKEPPEPIKWTEIVSAVATVTGLFTAIITLVVVINDSKE